MEEVHVLISGQVQGVGFRAAVQKHAKTHEIKGYVRNLPDGRVEICAQGKKAHIQNFLHDIQENPGFGSISNIQVKETLMTEAFSSFVIQRRSLKDSL